MDKLLVPEMVTRTERHHADDVPCVIALPIAAWHPSYLQWIHDEAAEPRLIEGRS